MKKLFTLVLVAGVFTTGFAQTKEDAKRVILGPGSGTSTSGGTSQDRSNEDARPVIYPGKPGSGSTSTGDAEIDRINREYDAKINSIRNNPTLSAEEKERMIRVLENERRRKINAIKDRNDDDRDDDRKKDKKVKGNNGNHYGWEKGVGNPHKNGGSPHDKKKEQKGKDNGKSKGKSKGK